jgi:hypothetical protein
VLRYQQPTLRNAGTKFEPTTASTTATPTLPNPLAVGDCMVMACASGLTVNTVWTTPSGWTKVTELAGSTNTTSPNLAMFYKVATATDVSAAGTTINVTHTSAIVAAGIAAFSGVDTTTPMDAAAVFSIADSGAATTAMILAALTIQTPGSKLVIAGSLNNLTSTSSPPTSWTGIYDRTTASARAWHMSYSGALSFPTGSTGTQTMQWSTAIKSVGIMVALRPLVLPTYPRQDVGRAPLVRASIF